LSKVSAISKQRSAKRLLSNGGGASAEILESIKASSHPWGLYCKVNSPDPALEQLKRFDLSGHTNLNQRDYQLLPNTNRMGLIQWRGDVLSVGMTFSPKKGYKNPRSEKNFLKKNLGRKKKSWIKSN